MHVAARRKGEAMIFRICGDWPVSRPLSWLVPHGTIIDTSKPEWSWVTQPPANSVALSLHTWSHHRWMTKGFEVEPWMNFGEE